MSNNFKEEKDMLKRIMEWFLKVDFGKKKLMFVISSKNNYKPYYADESFLAEPTDATNKLWEKFSQELQKEERAKVWSIRIWKLMVSGLTAYGPGYIDEDLKDLELLVGLQTDKLAKKSIYAHGVYKHGTSLETMDIHHPELHKIFTEYHKTHNQNFWIGTL